MATNKYVRYPSANGSGVTSVNTLTGDVTLAAGTNITLTPVGNTITIDASPGGGGVSNVTATSPVHSSGGSNPNITIDNAGAAAAGVVTTGTQTFAGVKTFSSNPVMSGLTASQAVVTDASKNLASLAYSATSGTSNLVSRDSGGNSIANNFNSGRTNVTGAAGTTTLTAASTRQQVLQGTLGQIYVLPDATTLTKGWVFEFDNAGSAGTLTIQTSGGGALTTVGAGGFVYLQLDTNSVAAGTWGRHSLIPANSSWNSALLSAGGALTTAGKASFAAPTTAASTVNLAPSIGVDPSSPSSGDFWWNGTNLYFFTGSSNKDLLATNTGTVTSVGLSVPATSIFGVSGSPVTSSGTLGLTTTGTSGGVPYFSSSSQVASSAALTVNALILGGGAGSAPSALGSLGTTTTVLHGNASGAPTFGAVSLTTDVSGTLPIASGGTGQTAKTAAFDALSPMTTSGDIIYGGAAGTGTRLPKGSDGQFLFLASGVPSWTSTIPGTSAWISYTPTFTNFGTVTGIEFQYRLDGPDILIRGKFTQGTPASAEARIGLPGGFTSQTNGSSGIPSIQICGDVVFNGNIAASWYALIEPNVSYLTWSSQSATSNGLGKLNASASGFSSGQIIALGNVRVPIQ